MEFFVFKENNVTEHLLLEEHDDYCIALKDTKKITWIKDEVPEDIEFNDEIISIDYIGEKECIDIEVSDDHLFICNGVLTKNSKALADTVDFLAALIYPEELREQNIQIWKVLKNRFGGSVNYRFNIRTEHEKCQIHDGDDICLVDNDTKLGNEVKSKPKKKVNIKIDNNNDLDDDLF